MEAEQSDRRQVDAPAAEAAVGDGAAKQSDGPEDGSSPARPSSGEALKHLLARSASEAFRQAAFGQQASFALAAAATVVTVILTAKGAKLPGETDAAAVAAVEAQQRNLDVLSQRVDALSMQLTNARARIDSISAPDTTRADGRQVASLAVQIADAQRRLGSMEAVVMENPTKALDLVLVRRDLEVIRATNTAAVTALKADVDRVYDMGKWILGLLFTMSLGVLSLSAASIFKRKD